MLIVGIVGGKGAGKNTAANHLAKVYGAAVYAIADELKELLRNVFKLSEAQLHGTQLEKETIDPRWGLSPRQLMERQGDALRLVYGDMFQIDRLLTQIVCNESRLAVISDIRYEHEAMRIQDQGLLWRLHYAPGLEQWSSIHSSEAQWQRPEVDLEIMPGRPGKEELHVAIDRACAMFEIEPI